MRRTAALLAAVIALPWLPLPSSADSGHEVVYLLYDGVSRYRPVVDSGGPPQLLADIHSITPPAVSPDGSRVAFSGAIADESFGAYAIFLVDVDGSGLTQLTSGTVGEFDPAWSPDGDTLVISQNQTGGLLTSSCCRLSLVDVETGQLTGLTASNGAVRPSFSPDGTFVVYDTPQGVWRIPSSGGTPSLLVAGGFDASVSPDGDTIAYLVRSGSGMELRTMPTAGGSPVTIVTTTGKLENPEWRGNRVYLVAFEGDGYNGRSQVRLASVLGSGGGFRTERTFPGRAVGVDLTLGNDEMFFYRDDGLFRYYQIKPDGTLPKPMLEGDGYTRGWSSITAVDLDGDGQDEMFYYRDDGLFRYYHIRSDGSLPKPLLEGDGYTQGWDAITAVDLDGDGQDEMFFYRADGIFRYYQVRSDGILGPPLNAGSDYPEDWSSITAIDLDGDGQDEMFFYRETTGEFAFYEVDSNGELGPAIREGTGFTTGWDVITSIELGPG